MADNSGGSCGIARRESRVSSTSASANGSTTGLPFLEEGEDESATSSGCDGDNSGIIPTMLQEDMSPDKVLIETQGMSPHSRSVRSTALSFFSSASSNSASGDPPTSKETRSNDDVSFDSFDSLSEERNPFLGNESDTDADEAGFDSELSFLADHPPLDQHKEPVALKKDHPQLNPTKHSDTITTNETELDNEELKEILFSEDSGRWSDEGDSSPPSKPLPMPALVPMDRSNTPTNNYASRRYSGLLDDVGSLHSAASGGSLSNEDLFSNTSSISSASPGSSGGGIGRRLRDTKTSQLPSDSCSTWSTRSSPVSDLSDIDCALDISPGKNSKRQGMQHHMQGSSQSLLYPLPKNLTGPDDADDGMSSKLQPKDSKKKRPKRLERMQGRYSPHGLAKTAIVLPSDATKKDFLPSAPRRQHSVHSQKDVSFYNDDDLNLDSDGDRDFALNKINAATDVSPSTWQSSVSRRLSTTTLIQHQQLNASVTSLNTTASNAIGLPATYDQPPSVPKRNISGDSKPKEMDEIEADITPMLDNSAKSDIVPTLPVRNTSSHSETEKKIACLVVEDRATGKSCGVANSVAAIFHPQHTNLETIDSTPVVPLRISSDHELVYVSEDSKSSKLEPRLGNVISATFMSKQTETRSVSDKASAESSEKSFEEIVEVSTRRTLQSAHTQIHAVSSISMTESEDSSATDSSKKSALVDRKEVAVPNMSPRIAAQPTILPRLVSFTTLEKTSSESTNSSSTNTRFSPRDSKRDAVSSKVEGSGIREPELSSSGWEKSSFKDSKHAALSCQEESRSRRDADTINNQLDEATFRQIQLKAPQPPPTDDSVYSSKAAKVAKCTAISVPTDKKGKSKDVAPPTTKTGRSNGISPPAIKKKTKEQPSHIWKPIGSTHVVRKTEAEAEPLEEPSDPTKNVGPRAAKKTALRSLKPVSEDRREPTLKLASQLERSDESRSPVTAPSRRFLVSDPFPRNRCNSKPLSTTKAGHGSTGNAAGPSVDKGSGGSPLAPKTKTPVISRPTFFKRLSWTPTTSRRQSYARTLSCKFASWRSSKKVPPRAANKDVPRSLITAKVQPQVTMILEQDLSNASECTVKTNHVSITRKFEDYIPNLPQTGMKLAVATAKQSHILNTSHQWNQSSSSKTAMFLVQDLSRQMDSLFYISSAPDIRAFEHAVCELQVTKLPEDFPDDSSRLSFLLNLFNLMVRHAVLLSFGRRIPTWPKTFSELERFLSKSVAYNIGDEVVYAFDVHRALFQKSTIVPGSCNSTNEQQLSWWTRHRKSKSTMSGHDHTYRPDPRMIFAITYGTLGSNRVCTADSDGGNFESHLKGATDTFFSEKISVKSKLYGHIIELPEIFKWHRTTLGGGKATKDFLKTIIRFYPPERSDIITKSKTTRTLIIRYKRHDWKLQSPEQFPRICQVVAEPSLRQHASLSVIDEMNITPHTHREILIRRNQPQSTRSCVTEVSGLTVDGDFRVKQAQSSFSLQEARVIKK